MTPIANATIPARRSSIRRRLSPRVVSSTIPATCYVFAYFLEHATEGLRLAWSRDGLCWEDIDASRHYLRPQVGSERLMRDPHLSLGPDGLFHLVWTTGWEGRSIGYARSHNLIDWSEQRELPVMAHEPGAVNCWAPEVIWDDTRQHYLIFWSSTIPERFPETALSNRRPERNHRIYSTTTRDWVSFTPTRLHYDGGFNVIDATLIPAGNDPEAGWLMFVKDETVQPKAEKNIRLVRANTPYGPFAPVSPPITGDYWAEGPSALRVGDWWYVYFDKHQEDAYGLVRSRDLCHWEDISDRVHFPDAAKHGSILPVGRSVIEGLYQDAVRRGRT